MTSLRLGIWALGLTGWVLIAACAPASAAEFSREGTRLSVSGALGSEDAETFASHLRGGQVRTVVFEDATDGSAELAETLSQLVRAAGVATEFRSQCRAACAYAFLAGSPRRFARGPQVHTLLIPLDPRAATDTALARTLLEMLQPDAHAPWQPAQGLLFTSAPTLFGRVVNTYWCDGSQGSDLSKCRRLANADPYMLGVLTP